MLKIIVVSVCSNLSFVRRPRFSFFAQVFCTPMMLEATCSLIFFCVLVAVISAATKDKLLLMHCYSIISYYQSVSSHDIGK